MLETGGENRCCDTEDVPDAETAIGVRCHGDDRNGPESDHDHREQMHAQEADSPAGKRERVVEKAIAPVFVVQSRPADAPVGGQSAAPKKCHGDDDPAPLVSGGESACFVEEQCVPNRVCRWNHTPPGIESRTVDDDLASDVDDRNRHGEADEQSGQRAIGSPGGCDDEGRPDRNDIEDENEPE